MCEPDGAAWIWLAFAPVWRLVRAFVVGKRTLESAILLVRRLARVTDAQIPFFTSDQLPEYSLALLQVYGQWVQPARRGTRGRYPDPRQVPPPDLLYAQVVKHRRRGHVVAVTTKVIFGKAKAIKARLASLPTSTTVNTSYVERENLTLRQRNRRLTRKTNAFSKELPWLEKQLGLSLAYSHLVLPHGSLRQPLEAPEPTRRQGSQRRWKPVTPAMAAGITDHLWTTPELLSYRVPVSFLDRLHELDHLYQPIEDAHQGS